jgi:phosphoribosylanthranilate isomerase
MVKICGLRRPEDALAADSLKPDLAGFILSPGFRRSIDPEQARILRQILSPGIRTVGVFVDSPFEEILQAADGGWIDMIQLHGKEDEAYIKKLTALTDLPLIKAFRIHEKRDLEEAAESSAKWILLDSGTGTGKTFDWEMLESFLQEHAESSGAEADPDTCVRAGKRLFPGNHPWLLAGGLSRENVAAAIRRFCPTAVDVSSKVETDGWKDPQKMRAFTETARGL